MPDRLTEDILASLASITRRPPDTIALESPLQDLGLDSLDTITAVFELEDKFGISIPDDDVRSIRTVNDVVEGIRKLVAEKNQA
ncbi:MAG: acyl carrier protein [Bryobacteraceae bacterium]|nr:acyl carrier protein [Bryobacteraceae bacterium]